MRPLLLMNVFPFHCFIEVGGDMARVQPDLAYGIPSWRISLQDYIANYVLALKGVDFEKVRILDLGCGLGHTVAKLSRLLPRGAMLVGIDIVREATERARELIQKTRAEPQIEVRCANAERTPFNDEDFDIVISNLSFSVFRRPDKVATEVVRILKPEGRLIATEVSKRSLLGKLGQLIDAVSGHLYYKLYSPSELTKLFTDRGLKLKRSQKVPLEITVLSRYLRAPFNISPVFLLELSKRSRAHQY
jgi:ubiquinone/menaquinone biosynthesis C-methylase UbiE